MRIRIQQNRRWLPLAFVAATALVSSGGVADDTAVFTANVPPNVLLLVDNSASMNEIMWHPKFDATQSTCAIFGQFAPGVDASTNNPYPNNGSGTLNDQNGKSTPYYCDPTTRQCRFTIQGSGSGTWTANASSFVKMGTITCPANSPAAGQTRDTGFYTRKFCGQTRNMYVDAMNECYNNQTWYSEAYDEWYFSPVANQYFLNNSANSSSPNVESNVSTDPNMIDANVNGTHWIDNSTYPLFKVTRVTSAREIARDVIFETDTNCAKGTGNLTTLACPFGTKNAVRFGVAQFDGSSGNPGGYVKAPIDDYSTTQATALANAISALDADTSTPLGKSLFKLYTYFMPRSGAMPLGKDGATAFPRYVYSTVDGSNSSAAATPDPLKCPGTNAPCACQKNFVIILTDGVPYQDSFNQINAPNTCTSGRTVGFCDFRDKLIGDFDGDGAVEIEEPANTEWQYLDDIALFMHTKDFRPDLTGTQTLDVYTVGFTTNVDPVNVNANKLLQDTATFSNGKFFTGSQAQDLVQAMVGSITDIIQKSQSFTAATVPASRTADGGNFYITQFLPSSSDPFWAGHLLNFEITADGQIQDKNGACAVDDPSGQCASGPVLSSAVPFWDAASGIPVDGSRNLWVSALASATPPPGTANVGKAFTTGNMSAADLGVTYPPATPYPGDTAAANGGATNATKAEYLADEIVEYVRGCVFGTGVPPTVCQERPILLGDIFHSNPVVIGTPVSTVNDPSYAAFQTKWATRDRMIYAGANDGFLHAFHSGTWQAGATPPAYDHGTGQERFAFMPWSARQDIKQKPVDIPNRTTYYVDGSPKAADVWFNPAPNATTKAANGSEWHTILAGGMRQGGHSYYALDVTDPSNLGAGSYLWEFPKETDPAAVQMFLGETWATPVMTKVKVAASSTDDNGGQGYERWVVIVTGGYSPSGDPNDLVNYDATATAATKVNGRSIYVLDAQTGAVLAQQRFDYTQAVGTPNRDMAYAIPSRPAVFDLDDDGFADVIYVGDLGGNVWKWVLKGVGHDTNGDGMVDDWPFRKFFQSPTYPSSGAPTHWHSFFYPPAATFKGQTLWLAFGSGERANLNYAGIPNPPDTTDLDNNRFYGVTDPDPWDQQSPVLSLVHESDLFDATATENSCPSLTGRGFFFRLAEGEKFVTNAAVFAYYTFISSFTPNPTTDPCAAGGTATVYAFKIFCGEGFFQPTPGGPKSRTMALGTGMPTDPRTSISPGSSAGSPCSGNANKIFIITSQNKISNTCLPTGGGTGVGVVNWRETP